MKREELKAKLVEAGAAEDKVSSVIDYVMAQNGAEINALKEELKALKDTHTEEVNKLKEENKTLTDKVGSYKDYEDLKKFKEDTIANAENDKRIKFLESKGCKHPDLVMQKLDFSKAKYDDEKKTYTGLDEELNGLKETYKDLFEQKGSKQMEPESDPNPNEGAFLTEYKKRNPDLF